MIITIWNKDSRNYEHVTFVSFSGDTATVKSAMGYEFSVNVNNIKPEDLERIKAPAQAEGAPDDTRTN